MKKTEKIPELSETHREDLARLCARPEFQSLVRLFVTEEKNIILSSFKVNSSDPELARKKSWHEGRIWELRKILKTFEEVKKGREDGSD